jgi:aryl-alcohol dehydrogenase-like predicted oxidoreductase
MRIVDVVKEIAAAKGVTAAQVALAWVHSRGDDVVPIPGTRRASRLEENVGALDVTFTRDELDRLEPLSRQVVGARY